MRLKALLIIGLITTLLLTNLISATLNNKSLAEETSITKPYTLNATPTSQNLASHPSGLSQSELSSYKNHDGTGTQTRSFLSLDSFVRDMSSHRVDEWTSLVSVDADSAELVIGIDAQPTDYDRVTLLVTENGGKLVNTITIGGKVIALVTDVPLQIISSFVPAIQTSASVRFIEPNMKFQTQMVPNDPYWNLQYGPKIIEADYAWDTTIGDPSVLVAVIDTGVDYDHPDLAKNYVPLGYDWVNKDSDPMDDHGHGTHVAGTIAAVMNNGIGVVGLAQVKVMAEKAFSAYGYGNEDDIANAIRHAVDQGADILSNSWGGPDSNLIHDAIKYAYGKGVLIIAAAGNSASSTKNYPAAYDEVIAVTATDSSDSPAWFTSFGDWVEVAAPGVEIYSTVWDNSYTYMSGTSMATPHVSGTAALIWSQFPNMTRDWVRAHLRFTVDDLGDPGFDKFYGYGRINARKAVETAPPEHDLLIYDWQRPKIVQPGDLVNFNVTVLNYGLGEESNMTVHLLVDGNVTDSEPIGFLAMGTSYTVNLLWNTTFAGKHNVTVRVEPVSGETNTENNAVSVIINVRFIEVALFKNVDPWQSTANEEVLSKYDIPYSVFTSRDFGRANITKLSKVIIASDQDPDFYVDMNAYRWWFEDYVEAGGMLEVHAADRGWNGGSWIGQLPGGLTWFSEFTNLLTIVDPIHQVVNIPNPISDTELDNWDSSSHGYVVNYPASPRIIIKQQYNDRPAYSEFNYGAGMIVVTSQPLEWAYRWDYSLILENSLLYFAVKYPHELMVNVQVPEYLEPGHAATLNATVYNIGLSSETNVTLQLAINGNVVNSGVTELPSGWSFTISYVWSELTEGKYNVTAYAPPVPDEHFTFNNEMTRSVEITQPLIRPVEGQWALYSQTMYDSSGRNLGTGYWNFNYASYVEPYKIYIDVWFQDPTGMNGTGWMIVNIMNRMVERGIWAGYWFPGWIETDITVGDTVNLLDGKATVNGSRIVPVGVYPIDCWEIPYRMTGVDYVFWYDKVSGLWIGMDFGPFPYRGEWRLASTNIPIGTPFEHETAVTLEVPLRLAPNDTTLVNATVYNIGLNVENNVNLSIFIDGAQVKSESIPTLPNGTSLTFSYPWTPTVEASYNVTAYVQPVPGEAVTVNNAATKLVFVKEVLGYILFDQTHYADNLMSYTIWISNLTAKGYIVDFLYGSPITPSTFEGYDVFVIPQANTYYSMEELAAIHDFVNNGGGLLVIGDNSPSVYSSLTDFAGITWDIGGFSGYTDDITPHPITDGVKTAYFGAPSTRLHVAPPAKDLIRDIMRNNMLAASEVEKGAVIAVADEDSVANWAIFSGDNLRLASNMIDWLMSRRPVVSFTYYPFDPFVGETVVFNASGSYDPDGTIVSYLWNFGDGTSSEGVVAAHVYAEGGTYKATLTAIDNQGLSNSATADVTVARTTIDVQVEVGSIHFRGEIAEFYILVSSLGKRLDADINVTLYYGGIVYEDLTPSVGHIGVGLYRVPFVIPIDASPGTYALVAEASYCSLTGVSLKSFLLSPTLTGLNALLIRINETVGTIKTDLGLIEVRLDDISATLLSIEQRTVTINSTLGIIRTDLETIGARLTALENTQATIQTYIGEIKTDTANIGLNVTAIKGSIATVQTTLGVLEGRVTSIQGDTATIETDIGTVKADISSLREGQQAFATPLYVVLALVIGIGAFFTVFFMRRKP